ncbi:AbrB/MazE/SpoVT family DNA-binding domain-containing protein [Paenibacillus kyungheensis]
MIVSDQNTIVWKRARVSSKRQVTIPQKLYEQAGIKDEVEFSIQDNQIILRPIREPSENEQFADLILADLIDQGLTGQELLATFRQKQKELRRAVTNLIKDSEKAAKHFDKNANDETDELFGDLMED